MFLPSVPWANLHSTCYLSKADVCVRHRSIPIYLCVFIYIYTYISLVPFPALFICFENVHTFPRHCSKHLCNFSNVRLVAMVYCHTDRTLRRRHHSSVSWRWGVPCRPVKSSLEVGSTTTNVIRNKYLF